jgi:hypothetical protein
MTMQCILTRFKGATNHNDARFVVSCQAKRKIFAMGHLQHELYVAGLPCNDDDCAMLAAQKLCTLLGWTIENGYGELILGHLPDGDRVFVFSPRRQD